ncbi:hypothetical protein MACK_000465 [Theileria orientalis]|uniref:TRIP4/RQT4 C2HC5-type zinc finger domain-containing protein n=1 Tax=Theileria orientalis TaxID=68886 RepID=A0A976M9Y0_THEOR|nr:hypothetical protein MACK_000465 [Theileria orientalis]
MEDFKKPHLIAYRKDSSNKLFKVEKKQKGVQTNNIKPIEEHIVQKVKETNRRNCGCNGKDHEVFSNCINCGRLLCILEREGPCFNCNNYVYPVDSPDLPKSYLDHPQYQQSILIRNKLLNCDKEYLSEDFKINDLHGGWFEESRDVYNEDAEIAKEKYIQEELEKQQQQGLLKYDLDLLTGTLSYSKKDDS